MVVGRASLRLSSLHGYTGDQLHLWLPLKDRKLRYLIYLIYLSRRAWLIQVLTKNCFRFNRYIN